MYQTIAKSLCNDFIDVALRTWNRLKQSLSTGISISEESITDFNLSDLQTNHPLEILTYKLPKYGKVSESKLGADWEWWLGSQNYWLGIRVQAKKLDCLTLEYPELDSFNQYGRQIDLLINNAIGSKRPTIPMYVFYNYWDTSKFDPNWQCRSYLKNIEMLGCSVSEASAVKNILDRGSKQLRRISQIMYPWSCLICCFGFSRGDNRLSFRAFKFLKGAFGEQFKTEYPFEIENLVREGAPDYVKKLINGEKLTEEELRSLGLDRITIIQDKKSKEYSMIVP